MKTLDMRAEREHHRELWDYLVKTGAADKKSWPGWERHGYRVNHCFACEVALGKNGNKLVVGCDKCPLVWPDNKGCCGLFDKWNHGANIEVRKKLAAQIRDLPWRGCALKVGDRVRVRQWDDMAQEFGVDSYGNIKLPDGFVKGMKRLCGQEATVTDVEGGCIYLSEWSGDGDYNWSYTSDMFELLETAEERTAEEPSMTIDEYNSVITDILAKCTDTLCKKRGEYATEDLFHNFNKAAELEGVSPKAALAGMMAKHTVSVFDMCFSGGEYTPEQWGEKIGDHINYLLILRAMVAAEERQKPKTYRDKLKELIGEDARYSGGIKVFASFHSAGVRSCPGSYFVGIAVPPKGCVGNCADCWSRHWQGEPLDPDWADMVL